jgi:hypothetical protein
VTPRTLPGATRSGPSNDSTRACRILIYWFMGWKRRRDRWRKLPTPSEHGLGFGVHWGRYQKIPKVPGGPELSLSTSGEVEASGQAKR